jgi:hypothetical protein
LVPGSLPELVNHRLADGQGVIQGRIAGEEAQGLLGQQVDE